MGSSNSIQVVRVIDGATYECEIDLGYDIIIRTTARLAGYVIPDKCGASKAEQKMAGEVTSFVREWVRGQSHLTARWNGERDAYGRPLVQILSGDDDLGEVLLSVGLAARDYGGGRDKRLHWIGGLVANWIASRNEFRKALVQILYNAETR